VRNYFGYFEDGNWIIDLENRYFEISKNQEFKISKSKISIFYLQEYQQN